MSTENKRVSPGNAIITGSHKPSHGTVRIDTEHKHPHTIKVKPPAVSIWEMITKQELHHKTRTKHSQKTMN